MIETKKYHPMDLAMGHPWRDIDNVYEFSKLMENKDGITFLHDGIPVAIVVLVHSMPGIGNLAMIVNEGIKQDPHGFTKAIREAVVFGADYYELRKCYALVDASSKRNISWIEHIGFQCEYTILDVGEDGQDMLGYSMNFEDWEE